MNPKYRADVWQWFTGNIMPRRKPVLRMIAIMSRWHEDDFIAQLLRLAHSSGWKYRVLDFPAFSICRVEGCDAPRLAIVQDEKTGVNESKVDVCNHELCDELGRLPGEALWPRLRGVDFLSDLDSAILSSFGRTPSLNRNSNYFEKTPCGYNEIGDER